MDKQSKQALKEALVAKPEDAGRVTIAETARLTAINKDIQAVHDARKQNG